MNRRCAALTIGAETMRREFNDRFTSPVEETSSSLQQFLAIRLAGQRLALQIAELSRLETRREIVPLPGGDANLLGIAGLQGRLVPIYSLVQLLGLEADAADCRWIAVCGGAEPFGLAFDAVEGCFSVTSANVLELSCGRPARQHVQHAVRFGGVLRNIVQIPSIQATLRNVASPDADAAKENEPWAKP